MAQFVITHGSFKVDGKWLGVGDAIEMEPKEAAKHSDCLISKLEFEAEKAGEAAKQAALKGKAVSK